MVLLLVIGLLLIIGLLVLVKGVLRLLRPPVRPNGRRKAAAAGPVVDGVGLLGRAVFNPTRTSSSAPLSCRFSVEMRSLSAMSVHRRRSLRWLLLLGRAVADGFPREENRFLHRR